MCRDSGFCVTTGFSLGRVFLGRGRGFSLSFHCRDIGSLVATETVTKRDQGCDGA